MAMFRRFQAFSITTPTASQKVTNAIPKDRPSLAFDAENGFGVHGCFPPNINLIYRAKRRKKNELA